jgi:hypothetical protein
MDRNGTLDSRAFAVEATKVAATMTDKIANSVPNSLKQRKSFSCDKCNRVGNRMLRTSFRANWTETR